MISSYVEVIWMEEQGRNDFYEEFENYLDDDEITPGEEGFMKGFTDGIFDE